MLTRYAVPLKEDIIVFAVSETSVDKDMASVVAVAFTRARKGK